MPSSLPSTIYALSSGRLPAAIAVVRISGPRAGDALKALSGKIPEPRKAAFARVRDPASGELIDEALALWFPGPNSETGEDTAELQLHGGRAVLAATLRALGAMEGLRPAEAGEFTRRAFENGKLDLTAVEGLAELVGAETEAQRRQAFRQMQGVLGKRADAWRERLIKALALVEAGIDFSDEGDVPADLTAPAIAIARELEAEISAVLADARRGERLREGLVVAIAGPPNAGKSTLLNRLAQREAAIVSPYAGTTRDVIEVHLDLDGLPVTLLDTAGIRNTDDPVEMEGVNRARERAAAADLVLWVVDASEQGAGMEAGRPKTEGGLSSRGREEASAGGDAAAMAGASGKAGGLGDMRGGTGGTTATPGGPAPSASAPGNAGGTTGTPAGAARTGMVPSGAGAIGRTDALQPGAAEDTSLPLTRGAETRGADAPPVWLIRNKADLLPEAFPLGQDHPSRSVSSDRPPSTATPTSIVDSGYDDKNERINHTISQHFTISSKSGVGLNKLVGALTSAANCLLETAEPALVTRERHRLALEDAGAALRRSLARPLAEDLLAEEFRLAARALERLTGRVDVEDVLDVIFRDFCIGK